MTVSTGDDYWVMGFDARMDGRACTPPVLVRTDDPRTLAYLDGYDTADHDLARKAQ